ncbi:hypothetical protein [Dokdonia sp.]|uniref:hypothetical protein n=1 Tax=Dokdonia sp. TaxID=2024995 RepID=UPI0032654251
MIKKTILTSIVLFSIWSIILYAYPNLSVSQHQWQDNYIRAEKYLYASDEIENVIIGSSLSTRIIMDSLPTFYNLSFGGQSTFDGLKVITTKANSPNNVFIEINVLYKEENKTFTRSLTSQVPYMTKKKFLAFRSDKQPLAIFGDRIIQPFASRVHRLIRKGYYKTFDNSISFNKSSDSSLFEKMKALQVERNTQLLSNEKITLLIDNLRFAVRNLEKKNINVIFFEMPVNIEIHNLSKPNQIRSLIQKSFPNHIFIAAPRDLEKYKTSDGIHLPRDEAALYTDYLKKEIKTINNNK